MRIGVFKLFVCTLINTRNTQAVFYLSAGHLEDIYENQQKKKEKEKHLWYNCILDLLMLNENI